MTTSALSEKSEVVSWCFEHTKTHIGFIRAKSEETSADL